jgi:hypothetical protein
MNLVAILAAPFTTVELGGVTALRVSVVILSIIALSIAVIFSKRGSIAEESLAIETKQAA